MTNKNKVEQNEHLAKASAQNLSVSTKHCIEICNHLRYKNTAQAKKILEDVIEMKSPIPFKRFKRDMGHKAGMAAGRFPQKAAKEVLALVKSVEANAQNKGLNTNSLKITKFLANKAATPMTGGRQRTGTKRTHVEIEVKETKTQKKEAKKKTEKKSTTKPEVKKEVEKKETEKKVAEEKPAAEKKTEEPVKETPKEESKDTNNQVEEKKETEKTEDIKKESNQPTNTGEQAK